MQIEKYRLPPLVSFVTWNRMGLTIRNLSALLKTTDDFELHIADSNSKDNTWSYIQTLQDVRIKSKTRLPANKGPIFAVNFNLSKRRMGQYFITVDSDVHIYTADWVSKFTKVFDMFPDAGLLGAVSADYYDRYRCPMIRLEKCGVGYLQITKGFVEGCMQCLRPELLDTLGYWCEECCMGDVEICERICRRTGFKAGYLPAIKIDRLQSIDCGVCMGKQLCGLYGNRDGKDCFAIRQERYRNPQFREEYGWKYRKCLDDMDHGRKSVFRASINDGESLKMHSYNRHSAEENFRYYEMNAN